MGTKTNEWNLLSPMMKCLFLYYQGIQHGGWIEPEVFIRYGLKARSNVGGVDWMKTSIGKKMLDYIDTLLMFRNEIPESYVNPEDGKTYHFIDLMYVKDKLTCNYATERSIRDFETQNISKILHRPIEDAIGISAPTIDIPDLDF